ncbi:hypothetical protein GA0070562_4377 [Micromonospora tulbaghiae]|uniref:Uncharacterized protein n=1 Tax=Micromonospora tulbaghiae TaxID=479978 RepID=A0ABY0KTL8_9ACTN|nr:hypothetical protein GA0070562_4377 [Micromonospora tulbaghiae]
MLHSGVDAPGGRDARAPSGAQSLEGSGCPRGRGATSRRRKHVQRPTTRHHSRGGGAGFTSSEPCSTTSPPGSFPAAHVARTELNDRQPGAVPAGNAASCGARPVLGRSPGYNATHPPTIPPSECRPPPPNRTPHLPAPSIMRLTATKRTPNAANLMIDPPRAGLAEGAGGGAGTRGHPRSCDLRPPGALFARFAGYRSARSRTPARDGSAVLELWCLAKGAKRASWAPEAQDRRQLRPHRDPVTGAGVRRRASPGRPDAARPPRVGRPRARTGIR